MQFNPINLFGFVIVAIMMIPNIIYAKKFSAQENRCGKLLEIIEQVGRYACMALMILPLFVWEFAFPSVADMLAYVLGNGALLLCYIIIWIFYFRRRTMARAMWLAILPVCIFLLSGICLRHPLLIAAAVLFAVGHISITYKNNK